MVANPPTDMPRITPHQAPESITPSTEVMQFLGRELWRYGGAVLQAEDEIAGLGAVVGASFAGRKAMTATSGPGMSLKTEMLGLATTGLKIDRTRRGRTAPGRFPEPGVPGP